MTAELIVSFHRTHDLHSIPSLSLHPCFSILLLVLTLTKNEEQILALERGTNSFSWTIKGGCPFKAISGFLFLSVQRIFRSRSPSVASLVLARPVPLRGREEPQCAVRSGSPLTVPDHEPVHRKGRCTLKSGEPGDHL